MRDTQWLQRAAAALTATPRRQKSKMVRLFTFLLLHRLESRCCGEYLVAKLFLLSFHSEEKVQCRFEVQQPHEHWEEKTLVVREPGEMCGHLR